MEADILLRMNEINVMPVNNVYGAIVLGMDTSNVDTMSYPRLTSPELSLVVTYPDGADMTLTALPTQLLFKRVEGRKQDARQSSPLA